jgi:hypothetical protein
LDEHGADVGDCADMRTLANLVAYLELHFSASEDSNALLARD